MRTVWSLKYGVLLVHESITALCNMYKLNEITTRALISRHSKKGETNCQHSSGVTIYWVQPHSTKIQAVTKKPEPARVKTYKPREHRKGEPLLRGHVTHKIH